MKEKQITLTFNATDKTFDKKLDAIKELFKEHDLMMVECGNIKIGGTEIKIERLMSGGPI